MGSLADVYLLRHVYQLETRVELIRVRISVALCSNSVKVPLVLVPSLARGLGCGVPGVHERRGGLEWLLKSDGRLSRVAFSAPLAHDSLPWQLASTGDHWVSA